MGKTQREEASAHICVEIAVVAWKKRQKRRPDKKSSFAEKPSEPKSQSLICV